MNVCVLDVLAAINLQLIVLLAMGHIMTVLDRWYQKDDGEPWA